MRRVLLWSLLTVVTGVALVLLSVVVVELRVDEVELPAPDPQQSIGLPDGTVVSLSSWLDRALAPARAPVKPLLPDAAPTTDADRAAVADVDALYPGMPWGPVFRLGEYHRQAGRPDQALALFQSIPEDDPDYSIARRRIALELLGRGDPDSAVPVVRQALAADPFNLNAWQDTVRVYGRALGLPLD